MHFLPFAVNLREIVFSSQCNFSLYTRSFRYHENITNLIHARKFEIFSSLRTALTYILFLRNKNISQNLMM